MPLNNKKQTPAVIKAAPSHDVRSFNLELTQLLIKLKIAKTLSIVFPLFTLNFLPNKQRN
jgi:hypothetical protein